MKVWNVIMDYGGHQWAREVVKATTRKQAEDIAWKLHPAALAIQETIRVR